MWCAEWFVARNGYTDLPVADTSVIARESIEFHVTIRDLLAHRQNSLGRRAVVVCHRAKGRSPGFTVGFLAPDPADSSVGRAVTMDTAFRALRVEHVGYLVARARADSTECRPLDP